MQWPPSPYLDYVYLAIQLYFSLTSKKYLIIIYREEHHRVRFIESYQISMHFRFFFFAFVRENCNCFWFAVFDFVGGIGKLVASYIHRKLGCDWEGGQKLN